MALVIYTPKYLTNPLEFIDPDKNKTIYDDYKKVVMRIMVFFKNDYRFRITRKDGSIIEVF